MASKAVYNYLKIQNRPYSVNDIVTNLQNEFSKSEVQKAVDKLVGNEKIFEKIYGKQKIYCVVQDCSSDINELIRIDRELKSHANEVEARLQEVVKESRDLEAKLTSLRSTPRLNDAIEIKNRLKKDVGQLTKQLDDLMEANGTEDLGVEKKNIEKILNDYTRIYTRRKRLCNEIIDKILEGYPGSKKELHEEIGIEIKLL